MQTHEPLPLESEIKHRGMVVQEGQGTFPKLGLR